jgi:peptidoglycan/LPS O-acetylase OafA/YrhL
VAHRNIWSFGVGMGLLACLFPNGPLSRAAAWVLSARVWYPVAQLSYCTYLFHLGFVMASYLIVGKLFHPGVDPKQALSYFALPELGLTLVFTVAMSFMFGAIIYVLIERPFINLRR